MRIACASLGLPYEVAMMDSTRGNLSQNKAVRELFGRVVETWQLDVADFVRWTWCAVIPQAWKSGAIPKAPVDKNGRSQWDQVDIQPPPATWADPQDAAETDAKNLLLGKITHGSVIRRGGNNRPDVWRQRAVEEQERQALAKEYGIDPDKIASVQMSGSAPGAAAKPAATPEAVP
jgi:capsid protein